MPALQNPRHEKACQQYVRGATAGNKAASYTAAGFKGDRRDAAQFFKRADVLARITDLQAQVTAIEHKATERALEKLAITKENVLAELAKIGFANMLDYVQPTAEGDVVVDLSALDRDKAAAISEVTVDTYTEGRGEASKDVKRVRFKLADKRAALVDIGKHLGMFVELRRDLSADFSNKSDDELRAELRRLADEVHDLSADDRANKANEGDAGGATPPATTH